jgi:hypothetical protein
MALGAVYYSPQAAVLRHPSGRTYTPNAAGLVTIPILDAITWLGGPSLPGGVPPATVFPNQMLSSTTTGSPVLLYWTGTTSDRPAPTGAAFAPPAFGAPYLDTTLNKVIYYVGPGLGTTNFIDQNCVFV